MKKILWVSFSTYNYELISNVCYDSLDRVLKENDEYIHTIRKKGCSLISCEKTGFRTETWYFCIIEKLKWATSFSDGSDFDYIIIHDCDIQFFERNWKDLFNHINNSNNRIFFMKEEGQQNQVNGGFYIIKGSYYKVYSDFIHTMLRDDIRQYEHGDQTYFNNNIHKLMFDYIPDKYVIWSRNIHMKDKNEVLLHHAVVDCNLDDKLKQMLEIKQYVYGN